MNSEAADKFYKPLILAVLTLVIGTLYGNWNNDSRATAEKADQAATKTSVLKLSRRVDELPDKRWLRSQFASKDDIQNFNYRIERNEADLRAADGRLRNVIGIVNRLCEHNDMVCSTRNAVFKPPLDETLGDAIVRVALYRSVRR